MKPNIKSWKRKVIIAKEKHELRVFDATTEEALYASALMLLTERGADDYWYEQPAKTPPQLDFDESSVHTLPVTLQESAKRRLAAYKLELREYGQIKSEWEDIQNAIKNKDGRAAWRILRSRSNREYEYVEAVEFEGEPLGERRPL